MPLHIKIKKSHHYHYQPPPAQHVNYFSDDISSVFWNMTML